MTPMELLNADEGETNTARKMPWDDRPRWASIQIRIDQMAVIEMLQARHLKAIGKESSRAEVLAALMAEGLERILNHANFGGRGLSTSVFMHHHIRRTGPRKLTSQGKTMASTLLDS